MNVSERRVLLAPLTVTKVKLTITHMKTLALLASLIAMTTIAASAQSLYDIKLKDIDGKDTTLAAYKGKAVLIVNVASKCGYTKQYAGLEATYLKYKDQGFVVLGFVQSIRWARTRDERGDQAILFQ